MLSRIRSAASTALVLTVLMAAQTGGDSIFLGSLKLTLGTSENAIRSSLPKNYTLELDAPSSNPAIVTGLVFSKPGRVVDNLLGDVRFQGGRLISASKDSGLGDRQDGVELARKLYSIAYALTENQERPCTLRTWQSENIINAQIKGVHIRCGKKYVELHIVHPDEGTASAGIREGVEQ